MKDRNCVIFTLLINSKSCKVKTTIKTDKKNVKRHTWGNDMKQTCNLQRRNGSREAETTDLRQVITVHFPVITYQHTDAGVPAHVYVTGKLTRRRCTKHCITVRI